MKEGVIQPVTHSDWAAPVVPVVKCDGSVRLCGDYKITVNKIAKFDSYPLPRIDDLFASLSGGRTFTKLDLAHAYLQVPLDAKSKKFTTINTHTEACISTIAFPLEFHQHLQFSRGQLRTFYKTYHIPVCT